MGLLFEINADPSKAAQAIDVFEKSTGLSLGKVGQHAAELKGSLGGALDFLKEHFVITTGDIEHFAKEIYGAAMEAAHFGEEIEHAALKTGTSAEQISALKFAADQAGVGFDSLQHGLLLLNRNVEGLAGPSKAAAAAMEHLGITSTDAHGRLLPTHELLLRIAEAFHAGKARGEEAAVAMGIFGRSGAELIPLLLQGSSGIEALERQAHKLGVTMTDEDAESAENLARQMKAVSAEIEGIKLRVTEYLLPTFSLLAATLLRSDDAWDEWKTIAEIDLAGLAKVAALVGEKIAGLPWPIGNKYAREQAEQIVEMIEGQIDELETHLELVKQRMSQGFGKVGAAGGEGGEGAGPGKAIAGSGAAAQKAAPALDAYTVSVKDAHYHVQTLMVDLNRELIPALAELPISLRGSAASFVPFIEQTDTATRTTGNFAQAAHAAAKAIESDMSAQAENMAKGLAGLIGGRRAQAGVEALWETARGIACLAEGAWPPNPAAILAAGLHFEAAAQYAMMAGQGSHHRSAAGAGGGYGASSGVRHSVEGTESGVPAQTLSPGAGGAGGRFSGTARVVVFGTDHELQNWVAGAVNGAVQRGVTVQATSSQRGAPVGH